MDKDRFDQVAAHLISSARDTTEYGRAFLDDHQTPPTLMAKVHHFRSIVQARLLGDDSYDLASAYVDFGRVEYVEASTEDRFLLKSSGALAVEKRTSDRNQLALFPAGALFRPAAVQVLIYEFDKIGLTLSIAPAMKKAGGSRVFVKGDPAVIGFWPFQVDGDDEGLPFDQDSRDFFGDVGDLNEDGIEGEEGS